MRSQLGHSVGVKVGHSDVASIYIKVVGQEMNLAAASIETSMTFSSKSTDKFIREVGTYGCERYSPTRFESLLVAIQIEAIRG